MSATILPAWGVDVIIIISGLIGLAFAAFNAWLISRVPIKSLSDGSGATSEEKAAEPLIAKSDISTTENLIIVYKAITRGAISFLKSLYIVLAIFIVVFAAIIAVLIGSAGTCGAYKKSSPGIAQDGQCWVRGGLSALSFVIGAVTSIVAGYIGMRIAVFSNARTAVECERSWSRGFNLAFRGGSVMGFALCGMGVLVLYATVRLYNIFYAFDGGDTARNNAEILFEAIAGFGLGGSSIAMFGRVGGGIYTKAADVGADMVGKGELDLDEDDARNAACIADNVGDNVGDIAGMGSDLFGSFAEASCAALVVAAASSKSNGGSIAGLNENWSSLLFPVMISALGILTSLLTHFLATSIPFLAVKKAEHVERNLKIQLWVSTLLTTPVVLLLAYVALPAEFCAAGKWVGADFTCTTTSTWWKAFISIASGLWAGLAIGIFTEFMTSYTYRPTKHLAEECEKGAAVNVILGLALGFKSAVVPVIALTISIYASFKLGQMFGVALAALGMLSTLATGLTIDGYGPITDNAGGLAEMSGMGSEVRHKTDVLDAAGNTTAAIGKGFAIGSAALVSLALFGAFLTRADIDSANILTPITFAGLLMGAMLPYWFSAMTMRAVGDAAAKMAEVVRDSYMKHKPRLDAGEVQPWDIPDYYEEPISISTNASLRQMIAPGALVMLSPIITGFFFGPNAVVGLLAGGLVSGVQMAISMSNTGGAWDNAKKLIEKSKPSKDASDEDWAAYRKVHRAAVTGDTVGDPLKDTSGPALNILMKLMAIISLVFAPAITSHTLNSNGAPHSAWAIYDL